MERSSRAFVLPHEDAGSIGAVSHVVVTLRCKRAHPPGSHRISEHHASSRELG